MHVLTLTSVFSTAVQQSSDATSLQLSDLTVPSAVGGNDTHLPALTQGLLRKRDLHLQDRMHYPVTCVMKGPENAESRDTPVANILGRLTLGLLRGCHIIQSGADIV